ncbi:MAG: hypothetical protein HZA19_07195 [Nitrospirae bacterium]|nr:hypothetical protein [Nitrospirota bacterium]
MDGIENKIDPGAPRDKDIYDMKPEKLKDIPPLPDCEKAANCEKAALTTKSSS